MFKKIKKLWSKFGPGVITGASDDDPSGIATYSMVGAAQGLGLLWTALITFPLMAAIQEMCARIGVVTEKGLMGNIKTHYKSKLLLYSLALLVIIANTINIGADLAGMAAATALIIPIHPLLAAFVMTILVILLMIYFPYKFIASKLKWLTFALFGYIGAALIVKHDWLEILFYTFVPQFSLDKTTITLLVAILGTTISPYLFFWQTSEEVEEKKEQESKAHKKIIVTKHELKNVRDDVTTGMFFSNLVMFAIIATAAITLHSVGITQIETADQAAKALEPIAGKSSTYLFAIGIIGTGMLAIPVLAGAAAYAIAEVFGWKEGLNKQYSQAKPFYAVILISTIVGFAMNLLQISPFMALFYTAVIYGIISPILILFILLISNNKKIMGTRTNGLATNILGVMTFILMTVAAFAFIYFQFA